MVQTICDRLGLIYQPVSYDDLYQISDLLNKYHKVEGGRWDLWFSDEMCQEVRLGLDFDDESFRTTFILQHG